VTSLIPNWAKWSQGYISPTNRVGDLKTATKINFRMKNSLVMFIFRIFQILTPFVTSLTKYLGKKGQILYLRIQESFSAETLQVG
jgi:hypothetical protein